MQKLILKYYFILISLLFTQPSFAAPKDGNTFGNWTIRCEQIESRDDCHIFQNLILQEGGSRVLHVAVGYLAKNRQMPAIVISMPLGISLPPGASLSIDDLEPIKFQIERCEPSGCRGGFKLKRTMLESFKNGKSAVVTFHDAEREAINVNLSLEGFTDGLAALKE